MLETLLNIDEKVFLFINVKLANPVTDFIMPLVTSDNMLRILYAVAIILLLWKGDRKLRWMVLASVLVLLLTDQISAGLLKPMIGRLRPCHELVDINLLVGCGGGKAMPSSHAANVYGQAVLFSFHYRNVSSYLRNFAALVAISRVFVGVHYVGDILGGALLGIALGLAVAVFFRWWYSKAYPQKQVIIDPGNWRYRV